MTTDTRVDELERALVEGALSRDQFLKRGAAVGLSMSALGALLAKAGPASGAAHKTIKAAWVYIGPIGDAGWTHQHNQGRLAVEKALGSQVKTSYVENVPETPAVVTRIVRQFAQKGNDIIFGTSFGYMDPMLAVAKDFPNTKFEHCSGFKTSANMGNYFGAMEEARYLTGIVAGKKTKVNKIGYVAAFPIPEVVRGLNAFTLGVRAVNPKATVRVVWTSTWYDPSKERSAAESLLSVGVDVLGQHQDTAAPGQAAQAKGKYWIAYNADKREFAPKAFLTGPVWNWGGYYTRRVNDVTNGTWKPDQFYGTMKSGMIRIAPPSNLVDAATKALVAKKVAEIRSGAFNVLSGPIKDQSGKVRIPAGQVMSLKDALAWQWLVEGVEGSIPKA